MSYGKPLALNAQNVAPYVNRWLNGEELTPLAFWVKAENVLFKLRLPSEPGMVPSTKPIR